MKILLASALGWVALVVFAAGANAAVTFDLLWGGTSASTNSVQTSSTVVLSVVLTNDGPLISQGGSVTIDYSASVGTLSVVGFQSFQGGAWDPLPLPLGTTHDTGSQIREINAGAFIDLIGTGLVAGASYLLGTVSFHKGPGSGTFVITSLFTGTDFVSAPGEPFDTATFNSATFNSVPEPGTLPLLALGIGGYALAVRCKN